MEYDPSKNVPAFWREARIREKTLANLALINRQLDENEAYYRRRARRLPTDARIDLIGRQIGRSLRILLIFLFAIFGGRSR